MEEKDWRKIMRSMSLITQLGIVILANIALGFYLGFKLDQWLNYNLIFKIIGILIGVASGFYSDYQIIKGSMKDDD